MLHADITYKVDDAVGKFGLTISGAGTGLSATLHGPYFPEDRMLKGYMPWRESGFAMLSRGLAEFAQELGYETGMFTEVGIRFTSTTDLGLSQEDVKPLCVATLACAATANRLLVEGPVLRMSTPVRGLDIPDNLYDLLHFLLKICDPAIGAQTNSVNEVPTYSATSGGPAFIFIEDLPTSVQPWFIAYAQPDALQRSGQLATAEAYQEFCSDISA
jgi:hypothetical protein